MKWTMMRHGNRVKHLGRPADQRKALIRSLVTEVLRHGQIRTTKVRGVGAGGKLAAADGAVVQGQLSMRLQHCCAGRRQQQHKIWQHQLELGTTAHTVWSAAHAAADALAVCRTMSRARRSRPK
jgi:hypothetical protein